MEIRRYVTEAGIDVFGEWLTTLTKRAAAKIAARLNRLAAGNFGDCRALRDGVWSCAWIPVQVTESTMPKPEEPACSCCAAEINVSKLRTLSVLLNTARIISEGRMTMKPKSSISHDEAIVRELRASHKFAEEYLKAALEDADEPKVLLIALRHLAEAKGGVAKVAKLAGIERESLYRALSPKGNPRLSTLVAVTKAMDLKLTVEATHN